MVVEIIQSNFFLFLAALYIATFILGELLERIKIPWVFGALFLGIFFSSNNPFELITQGETFNFLANLGLYLLLFIFGFSVNLKEIRSHKSIVFKTNAAVIIVESIVGMLIVLYLFNYDWTTSLVVGLLFATISEVFVMPLLEEFRLIKSHLGQTILGISAVNSLFLVFIITIATIFLTKKSEGIFSDEVFSVFLTIIILFVLSVSLMKLRHETKRISFFGIGAFMTFLLFVLFLFLGIGEMASLTALSAILGGIAIKNFLPEEKIKEIEPSIKTIVYGFFAPLFMFWSGLDADINFLAGNIMIIIFITLIFKATKIGAVIIATKKRLGMLKSTFLGLSLSVELSLSLVLLKIMLENSLIATNVYTLILAIMILSEVFMPFALTFMLEKSKKQLFEKEFRI